MVKSLSPRWIEYGLVILGAWIGSGLFVGVQEPVAHMPPQLAANKQKESISVSDESIIRETTLFGEEKKKSESNENAVAVAVASKLSIKLIGTVVAGSRSAAMVYLRGAKEQQVFYIGDMMQPGVILRTVGATEITVDHQGKRERINLEMGKEIVSAPVQQPRFVAPRSSAVKKVDRSISKSEIQKQMRNFSTLLNQARVTPHFTDKKADGFTISEIVEGSFYEEVGLQNGDIIQKVNGESVTSAEQAMRMYRELQSAVAIDVEINRAGSIQQISYTIQ